jgi:probable selenium-dependent hydroxylase accessory protein YqeC
LSRAEMVAVVGGGGKTTALRLLAAELTAAGSRVIITTTTAMLLREMADMGPMVIGARDGVAAVDLRKALAQAQTVGVADSRGRGGKVRGLPPAEVDRLWAEGLADYLLVEADGSRRRSLKAFGDHEPQVPAGVATVVQVAGLDAIGRPIVPRHVHRAELLAARVGVPFGSMVTVHVFAEALREQLGHLRRTNPSSRIVTLLNKVDVADGEAKAQAVAGDLIADGRFSGGGASAGDSDRPDAVVIASLLEGHYTRVSPAEG